MRTLRFGMHEGFPASSRFLSGHFPGNPVVPGAVIMAYLAGQLAGHGLAIARVRRVKFLRPLLPGVPIETVVHERDGDARFEMTDAAGVLASGRLTLDARR